MSSPARVKNDGCVTTIIPVYNRECLILDCLNSIQAQTYENFKVVVVDDGSTDKTVDVVKDFIEGDTRFSLVVHEENSGSQVKALANGFDQCSSEFVTWLGSDDTYRADAFEKLVAEHKRLRNKDFISYNMYMWDPTNSHICGYCNNSWPNLGGFQSWNPQIPHDQKSFVKIVYEHLVPPIPLNGLWKTNFFRQKKLTWQDFERNTWSPDTMNALNFFKHQMNCSHLDGAPLVNYRIHEGQDTRTGLVSEQLRCDMLLLNFIFENFPLKTFEGVLSNNDPMQKHIVYLKRLEKLIEDRTKIYAETHPKALEKGVRAVIAEASLYAWRNLKVSPKNDPLGLLAPFIKRLN